MQNLARVALLMLGALCLRGQTTMHYVPLNPGGSFVSATWTITNSGANFLITQPTGATSTVAKAAALTQSVALLTLPAGSYILGCVTNLPTAFAGTTTLTATVGITGSLTGCIPSGLNLQATAGTKVAPLIVAPIYSTNGTDQLILALTATISNVSAISAGSIKVSIVYTDLPNTP